MVTFIVPLSRIVWLVHLPHFSWPCDIIRPVMSPTDKTMVPPGLWSERNSVGLVPSVMHGLDQC